MPEKKMIEEVAQRMGASLDKLKLPAPSLSTPRASTSVSDPVLASAAAQRILGQANSGADSTSASESNDVTDDEQERQDFPSVQAAPSPFGDDGKEVVPQHSPTPSNDSSVVHIKSGSDDQKIKPSFTTEEITEGFTDGPRQMVSAPFKVIDREVRKILGWEDKQEPWVRSNEMSFGTFQMTTYVAWAVMGYIPDYSTLQAMGFDRQRAEQTLYYMDGLSTLLSSDRKSVFPVKDESSLAWGHEVNDSSTQTLLLMMLQGLTRIEGFPSSLAELKTSTVDMNLIRRELGL